MTTQLRDLDRHRLLAASALGQDVQLRHPLLAEAVRRRLVAGEASDVHRRLAAVLATSRDPSAAEIANHWAGAEDPEQELVWRIRAARAAADRFAAAQEADEWLRVLELWPDGADSGPEGVLKIEVYLACMDALNMSVRRERANELLDEAMVMLDSLPPSFVAGLHRRASHYRAPSGTAPLPCPMGLVLSRSVRPKDRPRNSCALWRCWPTRCAMQGASERRASASVEPSRSAPFSRT